MTRPRTSRIDDEAIIALRLTGRTQRQVADELGISVDVVKRHLRRPGVEERMSEERSRLLGETTDALAALSRVALARLGTVLQTGADPHAVAAARTILASALAYREVAILEPRLTALEQQAADVAAKDATVLKWRG